MKMVINECFGGFSLSREAYEFLGLEWDGYGCATIDRTDEKLIGCVKALGNRVNGDCAELKVVKIPDNATDWRLEEYDGSESITAVVDGKLVDIY